MVLLGNKIDLADGRETSEEEAAGILGSYQSPILYTSAKSGANVEEAFRGLARAVLGATTSQKPAEPSS
jgi:GTPase KRas protein